MAKPCLLDYKEARTIPEEQRLVNIVKWDWRDPAKSQILGKHFEPNMHHLKCENETLITSMDISEVGQVSGEWESLGTW
jgi:hypothetical protein